MKLPKVLLGLLLAASGAGSATTVPEEALPFPVMFVTQVPIPIDFGAIASVFANHGASMREVGRGGDLYIRYPDGTQRNLTAEAGFGMGSGFQGATAIAVRDPAVDWSGSKAVFSMIVGGTTNRYQYDTFYWQLYEISGLGQGQPVSITRVANQPADYNNIAPTYASDGSIIFTSDRPRDGQRALYPQRDEYESTPTVSGLWKLAPGGALTLLDHAPSGAFDPLVDSFGRVLFTRWDHLQRDQQNEDSFPSGNSNCNNVVRNPHGTFNYASEAPDAARTTDRSEVFPELRYATCADNLGFNEHGMKFFLPWQINQDGTAAETLNHTGRHEFASYFPRSLNNDPNVVDFAVARNNAIENFMQLSEDPTQLGRYVGIDAPEFATHGAGQLLRVVASPNVNAAQMQVEYLTPRSTFGFSPAPDHSGHYRNPIVLSNGSILAAHTDTQGVGQNNGTREAPDPSYKFRIKRLAAAGPFLAPTDTLTAGSGIVKTVSYFDPDVLVTYQGPLWELSPVEVRARAVPAAQSDAIQAPEAQAFALENVSEAAFRTFLRAKGLAVVVMRNVTTRDAADRQQPFNLRVAGGGAQTLGSGGTIYDIAHMQFFQADLVRGIGGNTDPQPGRRALAQYLHDPVAMQYNPPSGSGPPGSVAIASDGSVALYVPTRRAMAWQSTATDGRPVVRERFWVNFQPGEIRACGGCHGVNRQDQAGQPGSTNTAVAFRQLLARWRNSPDADRIFANGF